MLVWITGTSGVGKSTVCDRLRERGWRAVDADGDGFNRWVDRATGMVVAEPPDPVPDGWLAKYAWCIDPDAVTELASRADNDVAFLAGSVENEADVWDRFDHVVCLIADDATIRDRVRTRTTNNFGKHASELEAILQWNQTAETNYRRFGAAIIDGTAPVDAVTDAILGTVGLTAEFWTRLRHGYTNRTRRLPDGRIEKRYDGDDAEARLDREHECLTRLTGRLPLPEVLAADRSGPTLTLREVAGEHGQDLIDAGHADVVLRQLGALHLRLRSIDVTAVPGLGGVGDVIVHGDFGPQNVLFAHGEVTALLDWEFAHRGTPIEDLAWAEWIVRMHHPTHRDAIPELFSAAQLDAEWASRHAAMVTRCCELLRGVERSSPGDAVEIWRERLRLTEHWTE